MAYSVGKLLIPASSGIPEYPAVSAGTPLRVSDVIGQDSSGRYYYEVSDGVRSYFVMESYLQEIFNGPV